jgi:hypothetical protein
VQGDCCCWPWHCSLCCSWRHGTRAVRILPVPLVSGLIPYLQSILSVQLSYVLQGKVSLMQLSRSKMGGGIIATLLNLDNLMQ